MLKRLCQKIPFVAKKTLVKRHKLKPDDFDPYALKIIETLQKSGYEAYIVGGGVRDRLGGMHPKDCDVATNATPEEVKKLFKNCRLIGRRFRLAHIYFRRHIIEVATFRGDPGDNGETVVGSNILRRDNVYGTLEEDVIRRDFTVNALYYDPIKNEIVDLCDGLRDFKRKTIRLIGDPESRFCEDPVRILRAIRIANKLNFKIESATQQAIAPTRKWLHEIAAARIFDEYCKLFTHGQAMTNFNSLREHKCFEIIFPQTALELKNKTFAAMIQKALLNTDARCKQDKPINPAFLIAIFLWQPLLLQKQKLIDLKEHPADAMAQASAQVLATQVGHTAMPRRLSQVVRDMWYLQYQLETRRPRNIMRVLEHPRFRAAYDFLLIRAEVGEVPQNVAEWWTEIQSHGKSQQAKMIKSLPR